MEKVSTIGIDLAKLLLNLFLIGFQFRTVVVVCAVAVVDYARELVEGRLSFCLRLATTRS